VGRATFYKITTGALHMNRTTKMDYSEHPFKKVKYKIGACIYTKATRKNPNYPAFEEEEQLTSNSLDLMT